MAPWNAPRAKVQIKLSIQRLRTLQEKHLALAKKARREIADLLVKGRVETAKLRVEGIIQDDIYVELLELLELYSEKLQARFNLLDASIGEEPDPSIADAVSAIVYAAPRTDLKELQILREILMHKFGRAFSLAHVAPEPAPASVPPRVLSKLVLFTPSDELVDAYLTEIAKGYNVPYLAKLNDPSTDGSHDPFDGPKGGGDIPNGVEPGDGQEKERKAVSILEAGETVKTEASAPAAPAATAPAQPAAPAKRVDEDEELAKRFERLKNLK